MAFSQPAATVMLVSAIGLTAAVLALRQRYERRHREPGLSEADARHFARQDFRRALVGVVMVLLAWASRPARGSSTRSRGRANPWFLAVWLAVFTLIFILLWLALLDWIATWLYARRHRRRSPASGSSSSATSAGGGLSRQRPGQPATRRMAGGRLRSGSGEASAENA